jgi:hypothetical protein
MPYHDAPCPAHPRAIRTAAVAEYALAGRSTEPVFADMLCDSVLLDLMASDRVRMDSLLDLVASVRQRLGSDLPRSGKPS